MQLKLKIARSASGFNLPEVQALLKQAHIIFTTQYENAAVLRRMFPQARIICGLVAGTLEQCIAILRAEGSTLPVDAFEDLEVFKAFMTSPLAQKPASEAVRYAFTGLDLAVQQVVNALGKS